MKNNGQAVYSSIHVPAFCTHKMIGKQYNSIGIRAILVHAASKDILCDNNHLYVVKILCLQHF